ncbi:Lipoyltransferase [Blastocystis hominis]|uniref:lipoyl(octanoyl) transferase n=1 Tax=Blastocystis hominis TaxID=12968 RepID=D8M3C3_BLAHO|nr:Lipoyltransferase [Blastocystis hominis]CBK22396.2 Lipoyltransferase [Blastocystis hominis]|eukprot:XP_012896444.1 Lipoyltransferase [Blastocystis hominis]
MSGLIKTINRVGALRPVRLHRLGIVDYETVWNWQKTVQKSRFRTNLCDELILVQHPPVYTLGRGGDESNILFDQNDKQHKLFKIERGGEVTHHAPGQLVAYPILNLNYYVKDLHAYLRLLEQSIIDSLAEFDIHGERIEGKTGVYVNGDKIASIGIHVARWITMHGIAVNVENDLSLFDCIIPCGLKGIKMCSVQSFNPRVTLAEYTECYLEKFKSHFKVDFFEGSSISPLDSEQAEAPSWVKEYYEHL